MNTITRCIASFVLITCTASSLHAQITWTPTITTAPVALKGVDVPSRGRVVAVGEHGAITHSTDGGATWSEQSSGVPADLWAVRFWTADSGVAVGDGGTIITTYDGGTTWTERESGLLPGAVASFLFGITVVGDRLYAVGGDGQAFSGVVISSTNRGVTWTKKNVAGSIFFDRIAFFDAMNGLAVGMSATATGMIVRTTDGGVSWSTAGGGSTLITSIALHGDTAIAVASGGALHRSTDRGATWMTESVAAGRDLLDVAMDRRGNGIIVGDGGTTLVTNDGGVTWVEQTVESGGFFADVVIDSAGAAAYIAAPDGVVYRSGAIASATSDDVHASRMSLRIDGNVLHGAISGFADEYTRVEALDILGRVVARTAIDRTFRIALPAAGPYVIRATGSSLNPIIRTIVVMP